MPADTTWQSRRRPRTAPRVAGHPVQPHRRRRSLLRQPADAERFRVAGAASVSGGLLHGVTGGGGFGWVSAQSLGPVAGPASRVSTGREVPDDRHDPIHCPPRMPARIEPSGYAGRWPTAVPRRPARRRLVPPPRNSQGRPGALSPPRATRRTGRDGAPGRESACARVVMSSARHARPQRLPHPGPAAPPCRPAAYNVPTRPGLRDQPAAALSCGIRRGSVPATQRPRTRTNGQLAKPHATSEPQRCHALHTPERDDLSAEAPSQPLLPISKYSAGRL